MSDIFTQLKQLELSNGGWVSAEGSYFKATNATPGTGIAPPTTPVAFSATSAMLTIQNPLQLYGSNVGGSAGGLATRPVTPLGEGSTFMILDYFKFLVQVADTTAVANSLQWAITVDTTNRYSSGGSLPSQFCTNALVSTNPGYAPKASIHVGNVVATAASANVIQIGRGSVKAVPVTTGPLLVRNDEYVFSFGRGDTLTSAAKQQSAASIPFLYRQHAGVIAVPPGGTFLLHWWYDAALTGSPTLEFELGWEEVEL